MAELDKRGLLFFPKKADARLRRKLYLDESPGVAVSDNWTDIKPIFAVAEERVDQKQIDVMKEVVGTMKATAEGSGVTVKSTVSKEFIEKHSGKKKDT